MIDPRAEAAEALRQAYESGQELHDFATTAATIIDTYELALTKLRTEGFNPEHYLPHVRIRPQEHGDRPWTQVTIRTVETRGGGPYQDTINVYEATFEGGCPSNTPGCELPFGVPKAFNSDMWKNVTSYPPRTMKEREAMHYATIKARLKGMVPSGGWGLDLTDPRKDLMGDLAGTMGLARLERFELVSHTTFTSTFRLTIRKPNMS